MKKTLVCMIVLAMMLSVMLIPAAADEATFEPCSATGDLHIATCDPAQAGKCSWCGATGIPAEGFKEVQHEYMGGNNGYYNNAEWNFTESGHMATRTCDVCGIVVQEEFRAHNFNGSMCECGYDMAFAGMGLYPDCPATGNLHIGTCDPAQAGKCSWCGATGLDALCFKEVQHEYNGGNNGYYNTPSWEYDVEGHIATRTCDFCNATVVEDKRNHSFNDEGACECGYAGFQVPEGACILELTMNFVDCKEGDEVTLVFGNVFGEAYEGQTLVFTAEDNVQNLYIPKKDLSWMFGADQSKYFTITAPDYCVVTSEFVDGDGNDPATKGHATFTVTGPNCLYNEGMHIGVCDAEGVCGWCGATGVPANQFKQIDHKFGDDTEYYHHPKWEVSDEGHIATRHCEFCDETVVEELRAHVYDEETGLCECGHAAPVDEPADTGDITVSVLAGMMALATVGAAVVIKKRG